MASLIQLADDRPEFSVEPRGFYRAFDFARVVTWPDTLRIKRELDAAQVMHDRAMRPRPPAARAPKPSAKQKARRCP